jgi:hypothetical protein
LARQYCVIGRELADFPPRPPPLPRPSRRISVRSTVLVLDGDVHRCMFLYVGSSLQVLLEKSSVDKKNDSMEKKTQ